MQNRDATCPLQTASFYVAKQIDHRVERLLSDLELFTTGKVRHVLPNGRVLTRFSDKAKRLVKNVRQNKWSGAWTYPII